MRVIVFPGTKVRSVDTIVDGKIARQDGQPYSVFELLDLREALSTAFSSDAHFALYSLPASRAYKQARLSKRILPHLKQIDLEPSVTVLALDVDNPGHARHESFTSAGLGLENVYSGVANDPILGKAGLYSSRSGYRMVLELARPILVSEAEGYIRALIAYAQERGIEADPHCSEWTRLFRLPRVVRDSEKQHWPMRLDRLSPIDLPALLNPVEPRKVGNRDAVHIAPGSVEEDDLFEALKHIPADSNATWEPVCKALHQFYQGSEAGWDVLDSWSMEAEGYDPDANRKRWDSFDPNHPSPTTLGTVFFMASERGWRPRTWSDVFGKSKEAMLAELRSSAEQEDADAQERHEEVVAAIDGTHPGDDWTQHGLALRFICSVEEQGSLVFDRDLLYQYQPKTGHWKPFLEMYYNLVWLWQGAYKKGSDKPLNITASTFKHLRFIINRLRRRDGFFDRVADGIPVQNGRYWQGELHPRSSDSAFLHTLPIDYDPDAKCPLWLETIERLLPDPTLRSILQEFMGAALFGVAHKYKKAAFLAGDTDRGKSLVLTVFQALFLDSAMTSVSPQAMSNDYMRALMATKAVNIVNEMPKDELKNSEPFKAVVSGDPITARAPYGKPFTYSPRVASIFAANTLPDVNDFSQAFWRRVLLIPFEVHIPKAEQDRTRAKRIIATELPGVLQWAIEGGERLMASGDYTTSKKAEEAMRQWRDESDVVLAFLKDGVKRVELGEVERKALLTPRRLTQVYSTWAILTNHPKLSQTQLKRRMEALGVIQGRDSQGRYWLLVERHDKTPLS